MLDTATVRDDFAAWSGDEAYRQFDEWLKDVQAKAYQVALDDVHGHGYIDSATHEDLSTWHNPYWSPSK